jgi:uncharacterized protein YbcI
MRDEACSMVESIMGQRVIAMLSDNHVDPDVGIEVFLLEPRLGVAGDS